MKYWITSTNYDQFFYITCDRWSKIGLWIFIDLTMKEYKEIIKPTAHDYYFHTREEAQAGLERLEPYIMMQKLTEV